LAAGPLHNDAQVDALIESIVLADRLLATNTAEANANAADLERAEHWLAKADRRIAEGNWIKALRGLKKAWLAVR
jgi:hypothetical protein